ncbi:lactonase family protein [Paenibacillus sp. TRM 82003]|nr:lactonase family protein [Paenibacillus sp. TRM 82003]
MALTKLCFIGSYAEADSSGVYMCAFDPDTGAIELIDGYAGLLNPTFLQADARTKRLYALAELSGEGGSRRGGVAAFAIDETAKTLHLLNIAESAPSSTCHVELDKSRSCLMVSSYHGGLLGLSPILEDGSIGVSAGVVRHEGASVLPVQDRPRVHSVTVDADNRFAIVCDLGLDRVYTYRLDAVAGTLARVSEIAVAPGAGPRHFAFHPSQPFGYVINELNSTVTAFAYDPSTGALREIQTLSTLPSSFEGENACADIHLSPDGRFLYGSNRGHDSIAVYAVGDDGRLTPVEHASVLGRHPRNFALSPDGRFLLAANRDTNNVVVFARDADTGCLQPTGHSLQLSKPVCVKFL